MKISNKRFHKAAFVLSAIAAGYALPANAQLLDDAIWFEREVGDGVVWRHYQFDNLFGGKQSVSYMTIDLDNPAVELHINYREAWVGPSPGLDSPDFPRQLTSVFASEIPGAKGAINGSFFNTASYDPNNPNEPWGGGTQFLRADGETVHSFNAGGGAVLFNDRTDVTVLGNPGNWNSIAGSWDNVMANNPLLLANGAIQVGPGGDRHPRTVVGVDTDTNTLIFLVVDGRTDEADGMTVHELAQVLIALGANDGFNLDGGGSSTLWAAGEPFNGVVNFPSDNGSYDRLGQRRAANAIIVVSGDPAAAAWDGRLTNLTYPSQVRSFDEFQVVATYENIGTEIWDAEDVTVVPSRAFGRTSDFIPSGQENTFAVMEPSSVPPGQTATFTLNFTAPDTESDTFMVENFALWHDTEEYFGPADNELQMRILLRPELPGAPPLMIVQQYGPNSQWYSEHGGGGFDSEISFTAEGVANDGTQRLIFASAANRYAEFTPVFQVSGIYKVEVAFPFSGSNITAVEYTVNHLDGTFSTTINQQNSNLANTWIELGEFPFSDEVAKQAGVHSVTVGNGSTIGNRFYPGAVRFDFVDFLETSVEEWMLY